MATVTRCVSCRAGGMNLTASCPCKKTGLLLKGKPTFQVCCHCTICQKLTGTDYAHNMAFPVDAVQVNGGDGDFIKYNTSEPVTRHFCSTCATLVYSELSGDDCRRVVPVGTIDREGGPNEATWKPDHHIFYGTRVKDVQQDDVPKWSGFFDASERLG